VKISDFLLSEVKSFRSDRDEHDRLSRELAVSDEPRDPATLVASIEQSKRLGDAGEAAGRNQSEFSRMDAEIARDLKGLSLWSGTDEEFESLSIPMLSTVDQYTRDWEEFAGRRRDLSSQEATLAESIREKQAELERLGLQVSSVGEKDLAEARGRRNDVWELIRAFAFEKTLTGEGAQTNRAPVIRCRRSLHWSFGELMRSPTCDSRMPKMLPSMIV